MPEPNSAAAPAPILDVLNIEVVYNSIALVLKGVSSQRAEGRHCRAARR